MRPSYMDSPIAHMLFPPQSEEDTATALKFSIATCREAALQGRWLPGAANL